MNRPSPSSRPGRLTCVSDIATTPPACAARAASGKGRDARSRAEQTHCRAKALEWLQADLAIRRAQIEHGKPDQAKDARGKLRYWQSDADLAGVRDEQALKT